MQDLIIVGSGPAGMTAALYAARKGFKPLIIAKDVGGQVNWTSTVENYMGFRDIEGFKLIDKFKEQLKAFSLELVQEQVNRVEQIEGGFRVHQANGQNHETRAVVVATGKYPRPLNVPGESEFRSKGVHYCATCDAPLYKDKSVVVVGGGNSALTAVHDLQAFTKNITLLSNTPLAADQALVDHVRQQVNFTLREGWEVTTIRGDKFVNGITIREIASGKTEELACEGVFVEIGLLPNSQLVEGLAQLNERHEISVDCLAKTKTPGLFAAGDITDVPEKQIIIAAGEGAKAALAATDYLQSL